MSGYVVFVDFHLKAGSRAAFRDLVEATLPGIGFIPAVLSDDIAFIREYPLLPLSEVPQLAGHAREAYAAQLAAESSPHTRTDITWPSVGTP